VPDSLSQGTLPQGLAQRFVDFSGDLDRSGLLAVVGTLGKLKEGRRERLEEGKLGGPSTSVSVSGTQYFKVPASGPLQPQAVLIGGTKGKLGVEFDLQLARLPDGKERRQSMTANPAPVEEGMLALWVLAPRHRGKGLELLHVVAFDPTQDTGADARGTFVDAMRDFVAINQRVHDLKQAIAALEQAVGPEAQTKARDALRAVLDAKFEPRRPELQSVASSQLWPFEKRAKDRLGDAGK
jgi:hypothetical protein